MAEVLNEEMVSLLKETYLFHYLPSKFYDIPDNALINVYMRLLCTYDLVNEMSALSNKLNASEADSNNLKHILRCLRPLGLSYLATKQKDLLDRKRAVRVITALHDKVTSKHGKNISQRVRLVMKKELLSRNHKSKSYVKEDAEEKEKNLEDKASAENEMDPSFGQENMLPPPLPSPDRKTSRYIPKGWQIPRTPLKEITSADALNPRNCSLPSTPLIPPPAFQDDLASKKLEKDCDFRAVPDIISPPSEFRGNKEKTDIQENVQDLLVLDEIAGESQNLKEKHSEISTFENSEAPPTTKIPTVSDSGTNLSSVRPEICTFQNESNVHVGNKKPFNIKDKRKTYVVLNTNILSSAISESKDIKDIESSEINESSYSVKSSNDVEVPSIVDSEKSTENRYSKENLLPDTSYLDISGRRSDESRHRLSYVDAFLKLDISSYTDTKGKIPKGRDLLRTPPSQPSSTFEQSKESLSENLSTSSLVDKNISESSFRGEIGSISQNVSLRNDCRLSGYDQDEDIKPNNITFNILNHKALTISPLSSDDSLAIFLPSRKRKNNENKTNKMDSQAKPVIEEEKAVSSKIDTEKKTNKVARTKKIRNEEETDNNEQVKTEIQASNTYAEVNTKGESCQIHHTTEADKLAQCHDKLDNKTKSKSGKVRAQIKRNKEKVCSKVSEVKIQEEKDYYPDGESKTKVNIRGRKKRRVKKIVSYAGFSDDSLSSENDVNEGLNHVNRVVSENVNNETFTEPNNKRKQNEDITEMEVNNAGKLNKERSTRMKKIETGGAAKDYADSNRNAELEKTEKEIKENVVNPKNTEKSPEKKANVADTEKEGETKISKKKNEKKTKEKVMKVKSEENEDNRNDENIAKIPATEIETNVKDTQTDAEEDVQTNRRRKTSKTKDTENETQTKSRRTTTKSRTQNNAKEAKTINEESEIETQNKDKEAVTREDENKAQTKRARSTVAKGRSKVTERKVNVEDANNFDPEDDTKAKDKAQETYVKENETKPKKERRTTTRGRNKEIEKKVDNENKQISDPESEMKMATDKETDTTEIETQTKKTKHSITRGKHKDIEGTGNTENNKIIEESKTETQNKDKEKENETQTKKARGKAAKGKKSKETERKASAEDDKNSGPEEKTEIQDKAKETDAKDEKETKRGRHTATKGRSKEIEMKAETTKNCESEKQTKPQDAEEETDVKEKEVITQTKKTKHKITKERVKEIKKVNCENPKNNDLKNEAETQVNENYSLAKDTENKLQTIENGTKIKINGKNTKNEDEIKETEARKIEVTVDDDAKDKNLPKVDKPLIKGKKIKDQQLRNIVEAPWMEPELKAESTKQGKRTDLKRSESNKQNDDKDENKIESKQKMKRKPKLEKNHISSSESTDDRTESVVPVISSIRASLKEYTRPSRHCKTNAMDAISKMLDNSDPAF